MDKPLQEGDRIIWKGNKATVTKVYFSFIYVKFDGSTWSSPLFERDYPDIKNISYEEGFDKLINE